MLCSNTARIGPGVKNRVQNPQTPAQIGHLPALIYLLFRVAAAAPPMRPKSPAYLDAMDDEIMTGAQVAELLHVSIRTLEEWRQTHTGPPYRKMGKHVRYLRSEVLAWFEGLITHA